MSNDLMLKLAQRYERRFDTDNPADWVENRAKTSTWSTQRKIMESVAENRYTAVHSCHGIGKSWSASAICGWWLDSHPPGEAFIVTTAPSAAQVSVVLWREIAKLHSAADLRGRILTAGYPQWKMPAGKDPSRLVGYGRKPADYEESAFQGLHEKYVLVVIDEAGGVAQNLFNSVDALATNEYARVLAIGNPDDPASHFAEICKPGSTWHVIGVDGLRTPLMSYDNVVGPDIDNPRYPLTLALMMAEGIPFATEGYTEAMRTGLISPLWIEERIVAWAGVPKDAAQTLPPATLAELVVRRTNASPIFEAKVRGRFPESSIEGTIPLGWVQAAVDRWRDWELAGFPELPGAVVVGIDVATTGTDDTCFAIRQGNGVRHIERHKIADTTDTADLACVHLQSPHSIAVVDTIGVGAGVISTLFKRKREGLIAADSVAFVASGNSKRVDSLGTHRFRNDRAAAWWNLRQKLDPSRGSQLMLPPDDRLIGELTAVKHKYMAGGIIQIESKDDIRRRIGRSTDSADAVVQSFWVDSRPSNALDRQGGSWERSSPQARREAGIMDWGDYTPFSEDDFAIGGVTRR